MTKKQIIFSAVAFLITLIITLIITFPLNAVATKIIADTVNNKKIDIRYDNINITFFGTNISNLQTGPLIVKKITLDYNPFSLLFKRIFFNAESSAFILDGAINGNKVNANIKVSVAEIGQIIDVKGSGSIQSSIEYNMKEEKGIINVESPSKITFNHPLIPLFTDSLQGQANINKNKLTINNLSATGNNALKIEGYIDINKQQIDSSVLNINGEAAVGNYPIKFSLTGPARSPKISIK